MASNRDGEQLLTQQNLETWAHQSQDLSKAALAREVLKLRNRIMIMDMFPPPDSSTQKVEGLEVTFLERKQKIVAEFLIMHHDIPLTLTAEEYRMYASLRGSAAKLAFLDITKVLREDQARAPEIYGHPPGSPLAPPDPQQPPRPFVREKGLWPKWRGENFWWSLGITVGLSAAAWYLRDDLFPLGFFGTLALIVASGTIKIWIGANK